MRTSRLMALLFVLGVFAMMSMTLQAAAQAGQGVQITNGPVIETADSNSATIAWSTNQRSSTRVWYGTDKNNLTQFAEAPFSSGNTHRVQLTNLQANTTYYFEVESARGSTGSEAEGGVMSFRTPATGQAAIHNQPASVVEKEAGTAANAKVKITNGPAVERVDSNSATVAWSTNVKGSSRVNYGINPNNLTELAEAPWGAGGLTHRVQIKNLKPNTTYYFTVETGQAQGTGGGEVESQNVMSFTTTAPGQPPTTAAATSGAPMGQGSVVSQGGEKAPLYRLSSGRDRLYTTSTAERDQALNQGYRDEGIAGYVATSQLPGTQPLYRMARQNGQYAQHFYTTSNAERDTAERQLGYRVEGITGYVPESQQAGTVAVLRLQQPSTGEYLFTTSQQEASQAESQFKYHPLGTCCWIWQQQ